METIEVTRDDEGIVTITLNRPAKKNAINAVMWNELLATFREIAGNTDDRGVGTEQGRARRTGVPGDPVCGRPRRHRCPEVAGRNLNPARRCTDEAHEPRRPLGKPVEEPAAGRER